MKMPLKVLNMNKKNKVFISKSGYCPKCNSKHLIYDSPDFYADSVYFSYECKKCKFVGSEEYSCQFNGHSLDSGFFNEGEKIDLGDIDFQKGKQL